MEDKRKRDRSVNFSRQEIELLVDLVLKSRDTIENKRSDAVTWQQKEAAWERLTSDFNAQSNARTPRTLKVLKAKYEGLKRLLKKKISLNKMEMRKTGGGIPNIVELLSYEERLFSMAELSVVGLPARADSDRLSEEATVDTMVEEDILTEESVVNVLPPEDWKQWTPTTLRKPVNPKLSRPVKQPKSNVTEKLEVLAAARAELVNIQLTVAQEDLLIKKLEKRNLEATYEILQDLAQKKAEHELNMKIKLAQFDSMFKNS